MAGKVKSEAVLRANDRKLKPDLRRARGKFKKFGRGVEKDFKKSFGGVRRSIAGIAGFAGVAGLAALGRDVIQFDKNLTRLRIQTSKSKADFAKFADQIKVLSNESGLSRQSILALATQVQAAGGDFDFTSGQLGLLTKVVVATGASMEDVANVAVTLQKNFAGIEPANLEKAFDILAVGGEAGSVELKELASELGILSAGFKQFGSDSEKGLAELGAAFQVIQADFGFSPEQARTGLNAVFVGLLKRSKEFGRLTGVNVRDATGEYRNLVDILAELKTKGVGLDVLIKAIGGRAIAGKTLFSLVENLNGPDGLEGIRDKSLENTKIQKDFASITETAGGRISKAFEQVKNRFAEALTPERIDKMVAAFEALVDVIKFVADNASAFVALFVGAKAAQMGITVSKLVTGLTSAGTQASKLTGAMGLLSGAVGLVGAGIAGWGIGRALDEALGLSDAISDVLIKVNKVKEESGFLRGGAGEFGPVRRALAASGALPLDPQEQSLARKVALEAADKGVVGPGGRFNEERLAEVAGATLTRQQRADPTFSAAAQKALREEITFALASSRQQAALREQTAIATGGAQGSPRESAVLVKIQVDEQGLLKAKQATDRAARNAR